MKPKAKANIATVLMIAVCATIMREYFAIVGAAPTRISNDILIYNNIDADNNHLHDENVKKKNDIANSGMINNENLSLVGGEEEIIRSTTIVSSVTTESNNSNSYGCNSDEFNSKWGDTIYSVSCQGIYYTIGFPNIENCIKKARDFGISNNKCGLLVDLHGHEMNGNAQNNNTKLREIGNAAGYVVITPSKYGDDEPGSWEVTDDKKIENFASFIIAKYSLDSSNIHVTGFGSGGNMVWRLASSTMTTITPPVFKSFAPIAACPNSNDEIPIHDVEPKNIFYSHGVNDRFVNYKKCAEQTRDAILLKYYERITSNDDIDIKIISQDKYHSATVYTTSKNKFKFQFLSYTDTSPLLGGHCIPFTSQNTDYYLYACENKSHFNSTTISETKMGDILVEYFNSLKLS